MNKSEFIAALEGLITPLLYPVQREALHVAIALAHKLDEKPGEGMNIYCARCNKDFSTFDEYSNHQGPCEDYGKPRTRNVKETPNADK